jgi:hypothetical protein
MAEKFTEFIPLSERAVRRDGTISLKLIQPGWGSSGYYPREVLERDIPKVFPKGTHMMWNHATPTEEMERPEGDLRDLAAVTVSDPIWLEGGPHGPGMYAEARPFAGYANAIDEIGEHIGVSIRGMGRHTTGEAEGKNGRIIQEIAAGKSVDFVTVPGAGGAIVSIFESAPNAGKLPPPTQPNGIDEFLSEAGRVLSKANETKLKAALEQLTAVLSLLNSEKTSESFKKLAEARNIGEWLESRLHLHLTMVGDDMYGDGRVSREERKAMSSAIGAALDTYRTDLMSNAPQLFKRDTWAKSPDSDDIAAMGGMMQESEDAMSEEQLKEAQAALAERDAKLAETEAALAKMREQLLLREARDFVTGKLAETDLPEITQTRLAGQLARNPIATDGKLDEAAMGKAVETAVTEAQTEIAALLGKDGRVTGNGETANGGGGEQLPDLAESRKRADEALASMGYATVQEA